MDIDLNKIAKLEKAIGQKWGKETVANPKSWWTPEKEKEYLQQLKELTKIQKPKKVKENVDGVLIEKKLLTKETLLYCPVCTKRLMTIKDDIYTSKYQCCEHCYIQYIENREQRWLEGWRPKDVTKNT